MNIYQRETDEFAAVTVTEAGNPVTEGVMFSIVTPGVRPTEWIEPVEVGGQIGFMITGLALGPYECFVQATASPDVAVLFAGAFQVV